MAGTKDSPAYCGQCGGPVREGDRFCGTCGAAILLDAPQTHQPIPAAHGARSHTNRRRLLLAGALLVLVVCGAAVTLLGIGFGSVPADASPDPAFDLSLQSLVNTTDARIMLPAELPDELKNVGIDENLQGDSYGIVFLDTPPDDLVGAWPMYKIVGTLRAVPEPEYEPDQLREATSTESVRLPDGTEAHLRYMEPAGEMVNYGPQWEGTFDKDGYTYTLSTSLGRDGKDILTQALSSMVAVER